MLGSIWHAITKRWLRPRSHGLAGNGTAISRPPNSPFLHALDEPRESAVYYRGSFRGWCVSLDSTPITGIRINNAGSTRRGYYGISRFDLQGVVDDPTHLYRFGFNVAFQFLPDCDIEIAIEAQYMGKWIPFRHVTIHTRGSASPALAAHYTEWVCRYDGDPPRQPLPVESTVGPKAISREVKFSILMPVCDPEPEWLERAVSSVRAQTFQNWELCIADDASRRSSIRDFLHALPGADSRIKVTFRPERGHISEASNSALGMATGQFVGLLDHDDELRPNALAEVALAIERKPCARLIYSDEDKIDESGHRYAPHFKPDWDPNLMLVQNYVNHFSVYDANRLREMGGFRVGFEGSQDWDLVLRFTEGLSPSAIVHIPKILYHWRAIPGSLALSIDAKHNYPYLAAGRAISEHLQRTGTRASLHKTPGRHWRISYETPNLLTSVIALTENALEIGSIAHAVTTAREVIPTELLVITTDAVEPQECRDSRQASCTVLRATPDTGETLNMAVSIAKGDVLVLLGPGIRPTGTDWLRELVSHALRPSVGAVGGLILSATGEVEHAGYIFGLNPDDSQTLMIFDAFAGYQLESGGMQSLLRLVHARSAVSSKCIALRKSTLEAVGGFLVGELPSAARDLSLCLRVQKLGKTVLWTPHAAMKHASHPRDANPEGNTETRPTAVPLSLLKDQTDGYDPFYNINLALTQRTFEPSFPPRY